MPSRLAVATILTLGVVAAKLEAGDLEPRTVAAFDRYVRVTEGRMTMDPFLRVEGLPEVERRAAFVALSHGELHIDRLQTREARKPIGSPFNCEGIIAGV
jgi:hypothetical protein